jgi:WD40 domain-containing protein/cytochrome c
MRSRRGLSNLKFQISNSSLLLLCLLAAVAAEIGVVSRGAGSETKASTPSYLGQVQPILQSNCLACHSSSAKMGGLVMETYETLMKGGAHGAAIIPGKSAESRMVMMLKGEIKPQMPFGGNPLPAADLATLVTWIDAGAPGPPAGAATNIPAPQPVIPDIKPRVPVVSPISSLSFAPDGKFLAVGGYQEVRLIDAATGKTLGTLPGHVGMVRALAFSPDGSKLAAAGGLPARLGEIKIWDVPDRRLLSTLVGHNDNIFSVAFSPDGKLLATGSYDKLIKLWDVETGKELRTLKDHIDAVFAVTFSPDGKRLASGAADRTIKIWDVASGQRLFTLSEPLDGITTVVFRPSGGQLAAAGTDKQIRIWDLTDKGGTLSQSMIAHEDTILQLAYTPDGGTLISTSADQTIRIWDAATLQPRTALEKQPDWVQAMSISPDGKRLAAGRYDGSLSVYDLATYRQVLGPVAAFETLSPPAPSTDNSVAGGKLPGGQP